MCRVTQWRQSKVNSATCSQGAYLGGHVCLSGTLYGLQLCAWLLHSLNCISLHPGWQPTLSKPHAADPAAPGSTGLRTVLQELPDEGLCLQGSGACRNLRSRPCRQTSRPS